jgi:uncharacterized oligopeptide transporter (OPT) family protein
LLTFQPIPGAQTSALANIVAAVFVVIFGFLFVTVSSRICGLIGTSANPVSGMTIATLMATCAMFLVMNWTAGAYAALALTIGGVVCIAAANAGATSQDLKTGYLVGATPRYQQIGLILGVMASVVVIGLTVGLMNRGLQKFETRPMAIDIQNLPEGVAIEKEQFEHEGKTYVLLNSFGSPSVTQGKYLYDPQSGQVEVVYKPGIGSEEAAAPQAQLMATVIRGILNQRLPWRLVLLGVFFVIAIELLGIRSLSFAVGSYLSIGTTMAIFVGGVVRWLAERGQKSAGGHAESEVSPGSLYASGLIAAGGVIGLLGIVLALLQDPKIGWIPKGALSVSKGFLGGLPTSSLAGVVMYALLAATLFFFARKKLE